MTTRGDRTHTIPQGVAEAEAKRPALRLVPRSRVRFALGFVGFLLLIVAGIASIVIEGVIDRSRRVVRRFTRRRRVQIDDEVLDALRGRVSRRPKGMLH